MWAGRRPTANNTFRNRYRPADGRRSLVSLDIQQAMEEGLIVAIEPRSRVAVSGEGLARTARLPARPSVASHARPSSRPLKSNGSARIVSVLVSFACGRGRPWLALPSQITSSQACPDGPKRLLARLLSGFGFIAIAGSSPAASATTRGNAAPAGLRGSVSYPLRADALAASKATSRLTQCTGARTPSAQRRPQSGRSTVVATVVTEGHLGVEPKPKPGSGSTGASRPRSVPS